MWYKQLMTHPGPRTRNHKVPRNLTTVGKVISELGVIYRAARRNELPIDEAKGLAQILVSLRQSIEGGEIERRLEALEGGDATPRQAIEAKFRPAGEG